MAKTVSHQAMPSALLTSARSAFACGHCATCCRQGRQGQQGHDAPGHRMVRVWRTNIITHMTADASRNPPMPEHTRTGITTIRRRAIATGRSSGRDCSSRAT